jgi:hypothetical protein
MERGTGGDRRGGACGREREKEKTGDGGTKGCSRRDMRRGRGDERDGRNKEGGRVSLWRRKVKEGCIEMRERRS